MGPPARRRYGASATLTPVLKRSPLWRSDVIGSSGALVTVEVEPPAGPLDYFPRSNVVFRIGPYRPKSSPGRRVPEIRFPAFFFGFYLRVAGISASPKNYKFPHRRVPTTKGLAPLPPPGSLNSHLSSGN